MSRYNIKNFKTFYSNLENNNIDNEILQILSELAKKLNCSLDKNKKKLENDKYWESIRDFKATQVKNIVEDERKYLQIIRKNLNMITDATYEKFVNEILENLDFIHKNFSDKYKNICKEIYNLLSNNYLYIKCYSNIFKIFINYDIIFKDILIKEINNFNKLFDEIIYVSPDDNYEKFCDYNKLNESRRCKILFYSNIYLLDIITSDDIFKISNNIFEKLSEFINLNNKNNEIDEISEYNYLLITSIYNYLLKNNIEYANYILNKVTEFSNYKIKNFNSLTNKCIFKHMDIIDFIDKIS